MIGDTVSLAPEYTLCLSISVYDSARIRSTSKPEDRCSARLNRRLSVRSHETLRERVRLFRISDARKAREKARRAILSRFGAANSRERSRESDSRDAVARIRHSSRSPLSDLRTNLRFIRVALNTHLIDRAIIGDDSNRPSYK